MNKTTSTLTLAASLLALGAAKTHAQGPSPAPAKPAPTATTVTKAVAVLKPASGSTVEGTITFTRAGNAVAVVGKISGLTPGKHGFHIHEFGDCSAPDAASAGSHFNPAGHPHAGPGDALRHAGDLGNVEAGADGTATLDVKDAMVMLEGTYTILGRGVIVHAKADDLKTQPTGDAGGRLACGVVGIAKAP
jgi:superoxide dismutase, Cu-Zn family